MASAPNTLTLRQLEYVVAVADTLSFRRAAERCHVSQPSLSAQVAQLEDALGVRLFERDRRRVLTTASGRELVERARRVLLEAIDLVEAARRLGDPLSGTLRLGVIPTISPYLLPSVAPRLREHFPRLNIIWVEEKTEVLSQRLDAGTLDAAILALEAEIGDVEREALARDPFFLVAPPGHPLARKSVPAKPEELRDVDVLLLDEGHCFRAQALDLCARAKAHELEFRATSLTTLVQMVRGGAGVTLLPALAVPTEADRAGLSVRSFSNPPPARTIALVWRKSSPLGAALRELAAVLRESYPSTEPPRAPARGKGKRRAAAA
jgi:LysR family hydrogen peroxide-inducible transcriptional activator